ncbi:MAG: glucans biosynthesis protein G [Candidatus Binatia bacterium]|nr:MAG: glucans biosynthesis protein G [Candidatus Binatia bacterium]
MHRSKNMALGLVVCSLLWGPGAFGFGFGDVVERARLLAQESYRDTKEQVPQWMLDMTYDEWRDIRFRPERSLWRDQNLPFEVQFFHLGLYYPRPVSVNVVDAGRVEHVRFAPALFDYGKNQFADRIPEDVGFAGFRVHYPIKTPSYKDEVIVFLGASYFRALGRDQIYGLSARGLAINTVEPEGEEFPYFTEFWLLRPASDATTLTIFALMDSPSVTGAYQFFVVPGVQTRVDIEAHLFFREAVKKVGFAPLTSMFFHGENTPRCFNDFRPEVHDSDGLLLFSRTGEWLWRPLDNPKSIHVSAFQLPNPRGFGLLQRDRDFEHYQDLEARSELRPSAWQEVYGNWGEGWVELVELPTDSDIHDNIVAYWRPRQPPGKGDQVQLRYTLFWYGDDPTRPPGGRVIATRQERTKEGFQRFVVDFGSPTLERLEATEPPEGVVTVASGPDTGEIVEQHLIKNPVNRTWRLGFQVRPAGTRPVELRAFLRRGNDVLTETWSYTHLP